MASADGSILIRTNVDTTGIRNGTQSIQKGVGKINSSLVKLGATLLAVFSVAKLIQFGREAINLASDLQEVQNVVDVSFGEMSYKIEEFSKTAIENFGLSELSAKSMASTFMAMSNGMKQGLDVASDMAVKMTGRLADIMSFYNKSISEVETIGRAVYSGETEPLKQIGVIMTEAQLQTFALAEGYSTLYKNMSASEKLLIRQLYFLDTTNQSAGDFINTQASWANQTRILSERWKEFLTLIGGRLIQVLTPTINALNNMLSVAITLGNAMANIFGWQVAQSNASATTSGYVADTADSQEDVASATADTNKALKKQLAFFDDINVLSSETATSGTGASTGGTDTGATGTTLIPIANESEKKLTDLEKKIVDFLNNIKKFLEPTTTALKRLWDQGLSLFADFTGSALIDFYKKFLVPVGKWVVGTGFPNLVNYLNDLLSDFDWGKLQRNLSKLWDGLAPFAKSVGTGLVEFIKDMASISLGVLGTIGSILGGIGDGLKWMTDSNPAFFEGMAYAVASLVTALIGFRAVVALESSLKLFGATLVTSILSHPYLAVAAGVIALVTAFNSIAKATENQREIEIFGETIENLSTSFEANSREIQDNIDTTKEYVEGAGLAETEMADDLADKYFNLAEQASLTNDEKALMKQYASELVDVIPGLSDKIDEETGFLTVQRGEVDALIESTKEYYRVQASKSKMLEAYKQQLDAEENLSEVTKARNEAQDAYDAQKKKTDLAKETRNRADFIESFGYALTYRQESIALKELKEGLDSLDEQLGIATETSNKASEQIIWLGEVSDTATEKLNSVSFANLTVESVNAIESAHGIWENGKQILGQDAINIYDEIMAGLVPLEDGSYQLGNGSIVAFGEALSVGAETVKQTVDDTYIATLEQALGEGYDVAYDGAGNLVIAYVDGMEAQKVVALNAWGNFGTDVSKTFLGKLKKGLEDSIPSLEELARALATPFGGIGISTSAFSGVSGVQIPQLATGGVIPPNSKFMAILGDQTSGVNIETPLSTMIDAFNTALSSRTNQTGTNQPINLQVDGQTFARLILPTTLSELNRQGYNVAVLEG